MQYKRRELLNYGTLQDWNIVEEAVEAETINMIWACILCKRLKKTDMLL